MLPQRYDTPHDAFKSIYGKMGADAVLRNNSLHIPRIGTFDVVRFLGLEGITDSNKLRDVIYQCHGDVLEPGAFRLPYKAQLKNGIDYLVAEVTPGTKGLIVNGILNQEGVDDFYRDLHELEVHQARMLELLAWQNASANSNYVFRTQVKRSA